MRWMTQNRTLELMGLAALVGSAASQSTTCQDHWPDCGQGDYKLEDTCRRMGEEYDNGMVTKWQNITCEDDEYVSCSRVEFGALNGHMLNVQVTASTVYTVAQTSCYTLDTASNVVPGGWPGAIYPSVYRGSNRNSLRPFDALSNVHFKVECTDISDGADDNYPPYSDDNPYGEMCEYTAYVRCECSPQDPPTPDPRTTRPPTPPSGQTPQTANRRCETAWPQSLCGIHSLQTNSDGSVDVCGDTQPSEPGALPVVPVSVYSIGCPDYQTLQVERLQFVSTAGLIDVSAVGPRYTSNGITRDDLRAPFAAQNSSCLVLCNPVNGSCVPYPSNTFVPPTWNGNGTGVALSFINFTVSCAPGTNCSYNTFLRYKCYKDPSDDPTPSPHPLSQGGKKNTKSYVLLVVSVCVLGIIAIVVTKVVWQRRNGYRRQGDDFEDEHTIAMFGLDGDDPALRLGVRKIETNIVLTGTDDDAVWRPDPVTGKPTQGPGTPQMNQHRKAVSPPGSMPRRFDPQTGAPLEELPNTPVSPLRLVPDDGHDNDVRDADVDDELLITFQQDPAAVNAVAGAGNTVPALFDTPASDRFYTPMEGATPTPFAPLGNTPFASPFATPGQGSPAIAIANPGQGFQATPAKRRFDPKTGKLLAGNAATPATPVGSSLPRKFDSTTGQALGASSPLVAMALPAVGSHPASRFNPETGQPY